MHWVEQVKQFLCREYDCDSWEDFVDRQEMGQCQTIAQMLPEAFPELKHVFGEVEVGSYLDEDGEQQERIVHHWVILGGTIYDFAKGTLRGHLRDEDLYDPEVLNPECYHAIRS